MVPIASLAISFQRKMASRAKPSNGRIASQARSSQTELCTISSRNSGLWPCFQAQEQGTNDAAASDRARRPGRLYGQTIAHQKSTPRKSSWICSVACFNGCSVAFSNGTSLFSGMLERIVTRPVDLLPEMSNGFQRHVHSPMDANVCEIWCVIVCPDQRADRTTRPPGRGT